jgi:hypothetical protein
MHTYLRIYLNDQLALGVGRRELARRAQAGNDGTALGDALAHVAAEIAEDVDTLEGIMRRLGARRNPVKPWLAIAGERAGRLKLNGAVRSYSPLSRLVELDALVVGIDAKRILWATLRDHASLDARLPGVDFDALIARAAGQKALLEPFRDRASRDALGPVH